MHTQIVFVNQTSGYLMVDIVNAFNERGIPCSLITGSLNLRGSQLSGGIKQHNIIHYSKRNVITRLTTWIIGFVQIIWIVKFKYRKAQLFLVSNPPLVVFLPYFLSNGMSFLLYDLYPDVLVKYQWLKPDSWITKFWEASNRKAFQKAKAVFTISQNMLDLLQKKYILSNIFLVPLWADNNFFKPMPKEENIFVKKYGLEEKFLIVYSGNLGFTHDMDVLVDVAALMQDERIFFLIIGNGEKEELIKNKIREKELKNCMYLPFQPPELLPYSIGCADIGVVTLSKVFDGLSIPSKTFTLLSAGKPILCIASTESELSRLVVSNNIGATFNANDLKGMVSFIRDIENNKGLQEMYRANALKTSLLFDKSNANKFADALI